MNVAQKEEDLESLIKKEFSELSFYSPYDRLEVTKDENKNYAVTYNARKARTPEYGSYFKCDINLDLKQKSATWLYLWLDEEYRGRGLGGEIVKKGETMFKKLNLSTAYIQSNMNPEFWTKMGYPACLKLMKKSEKKSIYYHTYELLTALGIKNKKAKVEVTEGYEGVYGLSYDCIERDYELNFEIRIDKKRKTATWTRMGTNKPAKVISKSEKMLKSFGIKKVYVEAYYFDEEGRTWEKEGYKKYGDHWYKKL